MKPDFRVYRPRGVVAHLVPHGSERARCGRGPVPRTYFWYGVDSPEQKAKAKALPTCKLCELYV